MFQIYSSSFACNTQRLMSLSRSRPAGGHAWYRRRDEFYSGGPGLDLSVLPSSWLIDCMTSLVQGRNEGSQGGHNARAPKSPINVTSTSFNKVHSLPKDFRFECESDSNLTSDSNMGSPNLLLARAPSNLVTSLHW